MADKGVRFIRVRGRIVPIKAKKLGADMAAGGGYHEVQSAKASLRGAAKKDFVEGAAGQYRKEAKDFSKKAAIGKKVAIGSAAVSSLGFWLSDNAKASVRAATPASRCMVKSLARAGGKMGRYGAALAAMAGIGYALDSYAAKNSRSAARSIKKK